MGTSTLKIVVAGDIIMGWNLRRTRRTEGRAALWSAGSTMHVDWQRGGCALLADLVEATAQELDRTGKMSHAIYQPPTPRNVSEVCPADERLNHSFALWSLFKYGEGPSFDKEKPAWRVEEFLGSDRSEYAYDPSGGMKVVDDPPDAGLVVLDDAGLGFRDHPGLWPRAIAGSTKAPPWILLKMAKPVAQGPLWEKLHGEYADHLIVVTTVNDVRLTEVQISRALSWERTAQDVFWEIVHNPCVNALSHCAHVVVSFGTAGAILLSKRGREKVTSQCFLFFDPKVIEGTWELNHKGGMLGYTSCLTAGIACQLMISPKRPNLHLGIQSGLAALRTLHLEGHGERGVSSKEAELTFPISQVVRVLTQEASQFAMVEVQDPMRLVRGRGDSGEKPMTAGFWTILHDRHKGTLGRVAEQIVLEGPESALHDVPLGQFGDLLTVDRQEIESFRSIRSLVSEYCRQERQRRPLSIAVFGAPGSGKSFGITEVANSLLPGQIQVLEFNLSQFGSPSDLFPAFHKVRDVGLSGKIPLVFWDEVDATLGDEPLGWLRYFLAPMQDGVFVEGQISHPLGGSIFVFAGGTATSMAEFGHGVTADAFRAAKGPDFVSRLKGYVDILGANPAQRAGGGSSEDPYYIIRRAILIRSILKRNAPQLFEKHDGKEMLNIDRGVLRALLRVDQYRHGVRSIESIIAMSQLVGKTVFDRSGLPSESQLNLHVDGQSFLALVQQIELEGQVLEDLAAAVHESFCDGLRAKGYKYGPRMDDRAKTRPDLVEYSKLSEELRDQNRQNVRDIPAKLAYAGFAMIPARSNEPPFNFPGEAVERLARMEHERFVQAKLMDGWTYAPKTDRKRKKHRALLPWEKLPDSEKDIERNLVRNIPKVLARAGFAVVRTQK